MIVVSIYWFIHGMAELTGLVRSGQWAERAWVLASGTTALVVGLVTIIALVDPQDSPLPHESAVLLSRLLGSWLVQAHSFGNAQTFKCQQCPFDAHMLRAARQRRVGPDLFSQEVTPAAAAGTVAGRAAAGAEAPSGIGSAVTAAWGTGASGTRGRSSSTSR